jgi:hypothetical protein
VASHVAIASAGEAVVRLLRASYDAAPFYEGALDFQVYVAKDFESPMVQGVSLLIYRVYHNGTPRTPAGRLLPDGRRQRTKLPVDVHFLLTAWARTASLQHEIAGWMMRVMEDNPTLPNVLLNAYQPSVFGTDEGVEVTLAQLAVEELFRIWEVVADRSYQLSVPYVARMVYIESFEAVMPAGPVRERAFDIGELQPLP